MPINATMDATWNRAKAAMYVGLIITIQVSFVSLRLEYVQLDAMSWHGYCYSAAKVELVKLQRLHQQQLD
jgi:homogentisate 1,2-dioxygenase